MNLLEQNRRKILAIHQIRDLSFFLCVMGEVNFEGGRGGVKKADLIRGHKVWPKYSKRGKELRIRPGGNTFFDNLNV